MGMVEYRTALEGPNSPVVHAQQGICGTVAESGLT